MNKITLREFQTNAKKYINKLPTMITKYNKPFAMVVPVRSNLAKQAIAEAVPETKKIESGTLPVKPQSQWPDQKYGKPLSGRKATCPICYIVCPVEFAQEHYKNEHGDI